MKILHALGWYFPESVGGTEVYVEGLCRRLRAAGAELAIAAPEAGAPGARRYSHDGIDVFRYPIPALPTRAEAQSSVPVRGSEALTALFDDWRPDVVHVHSIVTGLGHYELTAAKDRGIATVLTHHLPGLGYVCRRGTLMEHGRMPCDGRPATMRCTVCALEDRRMPTTWARAFAAIPPSASRVLGHLAGRTGTAFGVAGSIADDRRRQARLTDACDAIVVLNEAARRILLANGAPAERIVVNRLGHAHAVIPQRSRATTSSPVRFGFVGRLHPTKGVLELVRAAASVDCRIPFELEIRGPAQHEVELGLLREAKRIAAADPRIAVRGPVRPAEMLPLLATYDVLCCPSTWFENGPTVAIEAMAVGTPVIGSQLGNLEELVADRVTGRLVPPNDVPALAAAIAEAAGDPALIDRWRTALPPSRTMDAIADDYAAVYRRIAHDRPSARLAAAM